MPTKITGKQASFTLNGVQIYFTKVTPKITRDCADTTDNGNYDSASDMIQGSQVPVKVGMELAFEGWFYVGTSDSSFISACYSDITALPVVLHGTTSYIVGHGNFDITDVEVGLPIADTATISGTLKQNGVFTAGS